MRGPGGIPGPHKLTFYFTISFTVAPPWRLITIWPLAGLMTRWPWRLKYSTGAFSSTQMSATSALYPLGKVLEANFKKPWLLASRLLMKMNLMKF